MGCSAGLDTASSNGRFETHPNNSSFHRFKARQLRMALTASSQVRPVNSRSLRVAAGNQPGKHQSVNLGDTQTGQCGLRGHPAGRDPDRAPGSRGIA